jgi:ribose transport system ATP-binding protein
MNQISKNFPGVKALDNVSFSVKAGEVHALVGENGAGKSTLMKILGGMFLPDKGYIEIEGKKTAIRSPIESTKHKIGIIYQEFNLVPSLRIYENMFLGKEPKSVFGTIDRSKMRKDAQRIIDSLGFQSLNSNLMVSELSVAQQQIVEISKALINQSQVVVMDEPTAVLTDKESEILFEIINKLKAQGVATIYISHRLEEIISISDRITVLRDGKFVTELDNCNKDVQKETIVKHMVGRELNAYFPEREPYCQREIVLEVQQLGKEGMYEDINFQLHKGEILGFFGLVGAGRTEVMKSIFGEFLPDKGTIVIDGKRVQIKAPKDAIRRGVVLVPEDRKKEGLVLVASMQENLALPNQKLVSRFGVTSHEKKAKIAGTYISDLNIKPAIMSRAAQDFSGGNQQKIVVGKWLASSPSIIIMDEPTRGIDIHAKLEIYQMIHDMTQKGMSVIVVSSEMMEVLGICDRILVMHEGKITGEFTKQSATQEKIMTCASGF